MDKARVYAVLSDTKRTIYATHKTELQAMRICEELKRDGVDDAHIFDNGGSRLAQRKYDKYKWMVI